MQKVLRDRFVLKAALSTIVLSSFPSDLTVLVRLDTDHESRLFSCSFILVASGRDILRDIMSIAIIYYTLTVCEAPCLLSVLYILRHLILITNG